MTSRRCLRSSVESAASLLLLLLLLLLFLFFSAASTVDADSFTCTTPSLTITQRDIASSSAGAPIYITVPAASAEENGSDNSGSSAGNFSTATTSTTRVSATTTAGSSPLSPAAARNPCTKITVENIVQRVQLISIFVDANANPSLEIIVRNVNCSTADGSMNTAGSCVRIETTRKKTLQLQRLTVQNVICSAALLVQLIESVEISSSLSITSNTHAPAPESLVQSGGAAFVIYFEADLALASNASLLVADNRLVIDSRSSSRSTFFIIYNNNQGAKLLRGENSSLIVSRNDVTVSKPFLRVFTPWFGCDSGDPAQSPATALIIVDSNRFTFAVPNPAELNYGDTMRDGSVLVRSLCGASAVLRIKNNVFTSNVITIPISVAACSVQLMEISGNHVTITGAEKSQIAFFPDFFVIAPRAAPYGASPHEKQQQQQQTILFTDNSVTARDFYPQDPDDESSYLNFKRESLVLLLIDDYGRYESSSSSNSSGGGSDAQAAVLHGANLIVQGNTMNIAPKRGVRLYLVFLNCHVNASTLLVAYNTVSVTDASSLSAKAMLLTAKLFYVPDSSLTCRSMFIRYNGLEIVDSRSAVATTTFPHLVLRIAELLVGWENKPQSSSSSSSSSSAAGAEQNNDEKDERHFSISFEGNWIEQRISVIALSASNSTASVALLDLSSMRQRSPFLVYSLSVTKNVLRFTGGLSATGQADMGFGKRPQVPSLEFCLLLLVPALFVGSRADGGSPALDPATSSSPALTYVKFLNLVVDGNVMALDGIYSTGTMMLALVQIRGWLRMTSQQHQQQQQSFAFRRNTLDVFATSTLQAASFGVVFFESLRCSLFTALSIDGGAFGFVMEKRQQRAAGGIDDGGDVVIVPVAATGRSIVLTGNTMQINLETSSGAIAWAHLFVVNNNIRGVAGGILLDGGNSVQGTLMAHSICFAGVVALLGTVESTPLVSIRDGRSSVLVEFSDPLSSAALQAWRLMAIVGVYPRGMNPGRAVVGLQLPHRQEDDPNLLQKQAQSNGEAAVAKEKLQLLRMRVEMANESLSVTMDSRILRDDQGKADLALARCALVSTMAASISGAATAGGGGGNDDRLTLRGIEIVNSALSAELRGRAKMLQAAVVVSVPWLELIGGNISLVRVTLAATMSDSATVALSTRFNSSLINIAAGTTIKRTRSVFEQRAPSSNIDVVVSVKDASALLDDNINDSKFRQRLLTFGVISVCVSSTPETECKDKTANIAGRSLFDGVMIGGANAQREFQALSTVAKWQADQRLDTAPRRYFLDVAAAEASSSFPSSATSSSSTALASIFSSDSSFSVTGVYGALQFAAAFTPKKYAALKFPSVQGSDWQVPCKLNGFVPSAMLRALPGRSPNSSICRCAAPWCTGTQALSPSRSLEASATQLLNCSQLGLAIVPGTASGAQQHESTKKHRARYANELGMSRPAELFVRMKTVTLARFVSVLGVAGAPPPTEVPKSVDDDFIVPSNNNNNNNNNNKAENRSSNLSVTSTSKRSLLHISDFVRIHPRYSDDIVVGSLVGKIIAAEVLGGFVVRLLFTVHTANDAGVGGGVPPSDLRSILVGVSFSNFSFTCESSNAPWITMEGEVLFEKMSGFGGLGLVTASALAASFSLLLTHSHLSVITVQRCAFLRRHLMCDVDSTGPLSFFEAPLGLALGSDAFSVPRGTVVGNLSLLLLAFLFLSLVPMVYFNWIHRERILLASARAGRSVSEEDRATHGRSFVGWFCSRLLQRGPSTFMSVRAQRFASFPNALFLFVFVPTLQGTINAGFTLLVHSAQFIDSLLGFVAVFPICGLLCGFVLYCLVPIRAGFDKRTMPRQTLHREQRAFERSLLYLSDARKAVMRFVWTLCAPILVWSSLLPPTKKMKRREKRRKLLLKLAGKEAKRLSGASNDSNNDSSSSSSSSSDSSTDTSGSDDDDDGKNVDKLPAKLSGQRRVTFFIVERIGNAFQHCRDDQILFSFLVIDVLPSLVFGFVGAMRITESSYWCNSLRIVCCLFMSVLFVLSLRRPLVVLSENIYLIAAASCLIVITGFLVAAITGISSADSFVRGANNISGIIDLLNVVKLAVDALRAYVMPQFAFGRAYTWFVERRLHRLRMQRRAGYDDDGDDRDEDDEDLVAQDAATRRKREQKKQKRQQRQAVRAADASAGGAAAVVRTSNKKKGGDRARMPSQPRTLAEIQAAAVERDRRESMLWWHVADEKAMAKRIQEIERRRTIFTSASPARHNSASSSSGRGEDDDEATADEEINAEEGEEDEHDSNNDLSPNAASQHHDDDDDDDDDRNSASTTRSVHFSLPPNHNDDDDEGPRKKPRRIKNKQRQYFSPAVRELEQHLVEHSVSPDVVRHVVARAAKSSRTTQRQCLSVNASNYQNRHDKNHNRDRDDYSHLTSKLSADEYYNWMNAARLLQPVKVPVIVKHPHPSHHHLHRHHATNDDHDHDDDGARSHYTPSSRSAAHSGSGSVISSTSATGTTIIQQRGAWLEERGVHNYDDDDDDVDSQDSHHNGNDDSQQRQQRREREQVTQIRRPHAGTAAPPDWMREQERRARQLRGQEEEEHKRWLRRERELELRRRVEEEYCATPSQRHLQQHAASPLGARLQTVYYETKKSSPRQYPEEDERQHPTQRWRQQQQQWHNEEQSPEPRQHQWERPFRDEPVQQRQHEEQQQHNSDYQPPPLLPQQPQQQIVPPPSHRSTQNLSPPQSPLETRRPMGSCPSSPRPFAADSQPQYPQQQQQPTSVPSSSRSHYSPSHVPSPGLSAADPRQGARAPHDSRFGLL